MRAKRFARVLLLAVVLQSCSANGQSDGVKRQVVDALKACIAKSPAGTYRGVWGSDLDFDRVEVRPREEADRYDVRVSEKAPRGKPQGIGVDVNLRTGECVNFTDRLE
jgi:hypothetical protein